MKKIRAALDLDGCLYPWSEGVREALMEDHGRHELADADMDGTEWNHIKNVVGDEHWKWIFSAEGGMSTLNRPHLHYPGVPKALRELSDLCDVTFITHRSPTCAAATSLWIASHDIPFRSLHCLGNDDGDHLPKSIITPEFDLYVEDSPTNVVELLDNTEHATVACPRRSYNSDLSRHPRLFMYDHIDEVVSIAKRMPDA